MWSSAPEQESMIQGGRSSQKGTWRNPVGWDEYDKSLQVDKTGCLGGEDENPEVCGFILKLRWDLANSYYWTGNFIRDFFFFVMQWHPLLGILMCHPNHPWTAKERFWMFMISVGLTFVPSVAISQWVNKQNEGLAAIVATDVEGTTATTTLTTMEYFNTAFTQEDVAAGASRVFVFILTLVFVTIPDTVIGVILYQLAIVDTRCKFCPCCIGCGKCLYRHTEYFAVVICLIMFTVGMWMLDWHPPLDAIEVLAWGKAYSYGSWFIIWFFLPCQLGFLSLWCSEAKEAAKEAKKKEEEEQALRGDGRSGKF